MKKIGLLSDTHSHLDPKIFDYFKDCDELWHAGDIGRFEVVEKLEAFKPLKAVYGNIDDAKMRATFPRDLRWNCEGMEVWISNGAERDCADGSTPVPATPTPDPTPTAEPVDPCNSMRFSAPG